MIALIGVSVFIIIIYFILVKLLPLVIIVVLSSLFQKPIRLLELKWHCSRLTATILTFLISLSSIIVGSSFIIAYLVDGLLGALTKFPEFAERLAGQSKHFIQYTTERLHFSIENTMRIYNINLTNLFDGLIDQLTSFLIDTSKQLTDLLLPLLSQTIQLTSTSLIVMIAVFLLSRDWPRYQSKLRQFIPVKVQILSQDLSLHFIKNIQHYIRAQSIVSFVTACILFIGFLILQISNSFGLALLIGFLDLIPFIGIGLVLWPWLIYKMVVGHYQFAILLIVLYGIAVIMRQFLEPKLLAKEMGLNSLIVILIGYSCYSLFGVLGILSTPFILITLQSLRASGIIHKFYHYILTGTFQT